MSQHTKDPQHFSWIPAFIREDFLRKAIALFFAVLFYFTVTSRLGIEEQINNIPVDIDLPTTLINMGKSAPKVSVIITGSQGVLKQLNRSSLKIRTKVQLSDYIAGEFYTLRINPDDVSAPLGVKIVRIEPRDIILNLDRKVSKKVEIKPVFTNKNALPRGYAVEQVSFQPSEVLITGPESILEKTQIVKTDPIPLSSSLVDSFDYETKISNEATISVSPETVNAQVKIIRQNKTRIIKNIPIKILEVPSKTGKFNIELLSSPHVAVTLNGLKSTIDLLKGDSIKPYIDISSLDTAGTFYVNVSCWVNSNDKITVQNIYPDKVQVKITPVK
jgi:YbbR domain-containing protein